MKKYYGIDREKNRIQVNRIQFEKWIEFHNFMLSKRKRNRLKEAYRFNFINPEMHIGTNAPSNTRHNPRHLIIFELIPKNRMQDLIDGIKILSEKYYKTGLMGGLLISDRTIKMLRELQFHLFEGTEVNLDYYAAPKSLSEVHLFKTEIKEFSASFCMMKFIIDFEDNFSNELQKFATDDFYGDTRVPSRRYVQGKFRKSIARKMDDTVKNEVWFEKIAILKWKFLNFIYNEIGIPLIYFEKNIPSPSVLLIDSNAPNYVDGVQKSAQHADFYRSMNVDEIHTIGDFEGLSLSIHYWNQNDISYNLVQYFYDTDKIKYEDQYNNLESQLINENSELFNEIGELGFLALANRERQLASAKYLIEMNKVKMNSKSYSKALKIKFDYKKVIQNSVLIQNEKNWKRIEESYNDFWNTLDQNSNIMMYSPKTLGNSIAGIGVLNQKITEENNLIDEKIKLLKSLKDSEENRIRFYFELITFIVTLLTFITLINQNFIPNVEKVLHTFLFRLLTR